MGCKNYYSQDEVWCGCSAKLVCCILPLHHGPHETYLYRRAQSFVSGWFATHLIHNCLLQLLLESASPPLTCSSSTVLHSWLKEQHPLKLKASENSWSPSGVLPSCLLWLCTCYFSNPHQSWVGDLSLWSIWVLPYHNLFHFIHIGYIHLSNLH